MTGRRILIAVALAVAALWAASADAHDGARRRHPRPDGLSYRFHPDYRAHHPYHGPYYRYHRWYPGPHYGYRYGYRYPRPFRGYGYYGPLCTAWVNGYLSYDAWGRPVYVPGYPIAVPCW